MIRMLGIAIIAAIKMLLCKGIALGIFLVLFWMKGKRLKFNSERWEDFFLQMSSQMVQRYAIAIYLIAASVSSAISYFICVKTGYKHSLEISLLLFAAGLMITGYKWHTKTKDYLLKRYQELLKTILEKREKEESDR